MTKDNFVKVYKGMVALGLVASKSKNPGKTNHEMRCLAFWLAEEILDYSRRDVAETILAGDFPILQTEDDLRGCLEDLFESFDDCKEILQGLHLHIKEYFGINN